MDQREQRKLKNDLTGFAHASSFRRQLEDMEKEVCAQLLQALRDVRYVDYLLIQLRRSLGGAVVIPAGQTVDALAKASMPEGDILLIVRSDDGVFANVLDSQTEPV